VWREEEGAPSIREVSVPKPVERGPLEIRFSFSRGPEPVVLLERDDDPRETQIAMIRIETRAEVRVGDFIDVEPILGHLETVLHQCPAAR
jgi:hypothetical protein